MPWFLWQLSVILHEGLWFKGTLLHLPFATDAVLVYSAHTSCTNLLAFVQITEPTTRRGRPQQTRLKASGGHCSTLYSCRFQREKNKFRLRAALSFHAQLQPRSLLIAEITGARNKEPGREWQHRCCEPRLPPFRALVLFPAPTTCPYRVGSTSCWRLSACEIANKTLEWAGLTSVVSFLHPSSDVCWFAAPLSPEDCRNSTTPLLSD